MDELAEGLKSRVAKALKDAGVSQRAVARELFEKETDRTKVREWLTTDRTMPAEFVAWVAERTGADCFELLTGRSREGEAEWRLQAVRAALEAPYPRSAGEPPDQKSDDQGPPVRKRRA